MENILYLVLGIFVGYVLYQIIQFAILWNHAQKIAGGMKQISDKLIVGNVTRIDDVYFVHNQNTKEFLAQGRNWEEIRTHFKSRFPDKICAIDESVANTIPRLSSAVPE